MPSDLVPTSIGVLVLGGYTLYHALTRLAQWYTYWLALVHHWQKDVAPVCALAERTVSLYTQAPYLWTKSWQQSTATASRVLVETVTRLLLGILDVLHVVGTILCDSYKSLLLCTIQLVIQGVLSILDAASHIVAAAVHDAAQALHAFLASVLQLTQGASDIATDTLNQVLGLFGHHVAPPTIQEPDAMRVLNNITIPSSLVDPFQRLQSQIPTVDTLRTDAEDAWALMLNQTKLRVNQTVPADLYDVVRHAYFRVALTMALLLFFAWGLVLCVQVLRRPPVDCACDEPEKHPYRLPWYTVWWQWCQTPLSLCLVAFLCLELIGLALTAWILRALTQTLRHGLPADISLVPTPPWADYLERTLPDTVHATQTQLDAASATLNDALFGWLHQAVPLAQQVLEGVEGLVSDTIRDLLGPTPLRTPVTQFANCVLGHKIEAAEHALTWLSTHAYLQLPSLPFEIIASYDAT
ncbi:cytogamy plasma membrane fusion protein [Malassezia pachydermatis]